VGQQFTFPVEGRRDPRSGLLKIVTDNYLPVLFEGPDALRETTVTVRIEAVGRGASLTGHLD
jgi:hypothetical protein